MAKKKSTWKSGTFVLDCSVAMAWCFHDEADPYADAIVARFPDVRAVTPALWLLEIANALLVGERRKRSTEADTTHWLGSLSSLPITVDDETATRAWSDSLHLARSHHLSVYDAAYLELALRRGLPLATLDHKLKAAANAAGVKEFKP